jgi:hypothetical protein
MIQRFTAISTLLVCWVLGASGCGDSSSQNQSDKGQGKNVEPDARVQLPRETTVNLGEVDFGDEKKHTFEVLNRGGSPLTWKLARKNCSCFDIVMKPADAVPAGEKGQVTLSWIPRPGHYGAKVLSVDLETNDPQTRTIHLELLSQINPKVRVSPKEWEWLDFDRIEPGRIQERTLTLYSTELDKFELKAQVSHPGLTVKTKPLPSGTQVDALTAKSGYIVTVATTADPPEGNFMETLTLTVGGKENRVIPIPIYGESASGLFKLAPDKVIFETPNIADGASQRVDLYLFNAKGQEKVEVVERTPSFLQVEVVDLPAKSGKKWRIKVTVPRGNPEAAAFQADKYFQGRVVLKIDPGGPKVQFRVVWDGEKK